MKRLVHVTGGSNTLLLAGVMALALPVLAHGATRHVANTGGDGPGCGITAAAACRSISQAIGLAAAGDTVSVGPGFYGDLNRNGFLGEAGEEFGAPGCGCVIALNKPLIVTSTDGAAVTFIDGRTIHTNVTVLIITIGGEFGRPGKGFTVTETARISGGAFSGHGIVLDAIDVMVRGNQVVFTRPASPSSGTGISTVNHAPIRIEGNQVTHWGTGISVRGAATASKNQVMFNKTGISAVGGQVVGNVATANSFAGIQVFESAAVEGNAASMNLYGIYVQGPFSGVVNRNNMVASTLCGLANVQAVGLQATNNYWGSASGPGGLPANDGVCQWDPTATTTTSPFAVKPFAVKIVKP